MKLLASIHDDESGVTSIAERSLMRQLDGGCSTPIAVRSTLSKDGMLTLRASVMSVDGEQSVSDESCALLPEEDVDTFLANLRGGSSDNDEVDSDDEDLPVRKRVKRTAGYFEMTDKEVQLGRDDQAHFLGVRVAPICEIGRVRMALSQRLGAVLAHKLLAAGARQILDGIQKTRGEIESIARNEDSKLII